MKSLFFTFLACLLFIGAQAATMPVSQSTGTVTEAKLVDASSVQKARQAKLTLKERLANSLVKRAIKRANRKAAKKGVEGTNSLLFADLIVVAGVIVTIAGIITIISSPLQGVIVALLGLLVYLLGKGAGGSLSHIF